MSEDSKTTPQSRLKIKKIPGINYLVIEKLSPKDGFFYTSDRAITMAVSSFSYLLLFLVMNEYVSPKVLEGILEEYYSNR
jgi:hypothetical protein